MHIKITVEIVIYSTSTLVDVVTLLLTNHVLDFHIDKKTINSRDNKMNIIGESLLNYNVTFTTDKYELVTDIKTLVDTELEKLTK